jgi:hypothetical protein
MAAQPISESGAVYSRSGYVGLPASRPISIGGSYQVAGSLLASGPLRPVSDAGVRADQGGFVRAGAERVLAPALAQYVTGSIVSLLNLRVLSQALDGYAPGSMLRSSLVRPISPGYLLFIPAPPAPPVDATAPAVGNFSPAPGTPIARTRAVSFDVTDESGDFRRIFVVAFFPATGVTEVVHDGDGFRGFYAASSSRTMIAAGFRYAVLRSGGWPAAPTIQTFAIDRAGNEAN